MATYRNLTRATLALLLTLTIVACGTTPYKPQSRQSQDRPQEVQQAQGRAHSKPSAQSNVRRVKKDTSPTSSEPAKNDWKKINKDGFKGSFEQSCEVIELSESECKQFTKMHEADQCEDWDQIPEDTVFDLMAITVSGVNKPWNNVRTRLKNPQHSSATYCQIGKKAVVLPHYCNNLSVIYWDPYEDIPVRKYSRKAYKNPVAGCPYSSRFQLTYIWEKAAINHECSRRLANVSGTNGIDGERLSRSCGRQLREGNYRPGIVNHPWEMIFIPDNQSGDEVYEYSIFKGSIQGNMLHAASGYEDMVVDNAVKIPESIEVDGHLIPLDYGLLETRLALSELSSPRNGRMHERIEEYEYGCTPKIVTGIE